MIQNESLSVSLKASIWIVTTPLEGSPQRLPPGMVGWPKVLLEKGFEVVQMPWPRLLLQKLWHALWQENAKGKQLERPRGMYVDTRKNVCHCRET